MFDFDGAQVTTISVWWWWMIPPHAHFTYGIGQIFTSIEVPWTIEFIQNLKKKKKTPKTKEDITIELNTIFYR